MHTFKVINNTILLIQYLVFWLRVIGRLKKLYLIIETLTLQRAHINKKFYYTRQYCLPKLIFVYQQISFPLRIFLDTIYSANFPLFRAISTIVNGITSMNGWYIPFSCLYKGRLTKDNNRHTLQSSFRFAVSYCMLIAINSRYNSDWY